MHNATQTLLLDGLSIPLLRKKIRNVNLRVHRPDGAVTISAPLRLDIDTIRRFALSKLDWIRQQQIKVRTHKTATPLAYVSGESHFYLGQRYILEVMEKKTSPKVILKPGVIEMHIRPGATKAQRFALLETWYKKRLKEIILPYLGPLERTMQVRPTAIAIRTMKTRWGTCNIRTKKITLNSELAKRPLESIEYVLVHEMVHLLERGHKERFKGYMDRFLPGWKGRRAELKILGH
ncbi:MAG: SprT family zinc-dependent metalloprotease [Candidatus Margulisiibacteriota bacterium]|jgi:hypothetical protein